MPVLIGTDLETLQILLGVTEIPEKYAREYRIRKRMYDRIGGGGPLGTIALVDLLRFCGFSLRDLIEPPAETNWDGVRKGARVEVLIDNEWKPGEFLGFGELKTLHVQLDHDPWVKECPKSLVRLAKEQKKPAIEKVVTEVVQTVVAEQPTDEGMYSPWNQQPAGLNVWVEMENDLKDGTFVRVHDAERVVVEVNGEEHVVKNGVVNIAEQATV